MNELKNTLTAKKIHEGIGVNKTDKCWNWFGACVKKGK